MDNNVIIGKHTLESLTTGMYNDPKIIYREYIQNSVDSLEVAVNAGIIEPQSMRIDIIINNENSSLRFLDNGIGVKCSQVATVLTSIGSSKKRSGNNRGFRGIGRLGGMSYCDYLVFSTSSEGEAVKSIIKFDCKKLKELLLPGKYDDLTMASVIDQITTIDYLPEKEDKHYFCVEMKNISAFSDIMDIDTVRSYISQVAPVPYHKRHFIYTTELKEYLLKEKYQIEEFPIFVGESEFDLEPVYKPNKSRFFSDRNKKLHDDIYSLRCFNITVDGELYALGWYGNCSWLGSLPEKEISGFRIRKGNILIGDNKTLNGIFKEARFNGWTQGEIFVQTDKLIPNARRDDFEHNEAYYKFSEVLSSQIGLEITKIIREASLTRNNPNSKALRKAEELIKAASVVLNKGFNSSLDKNNLISKLQNTYTEINNHRVDEKLINKKTEILEKINIITQDVINSNNYKINNINSGIDKKSKQILKIVSDILSKNLSKVLADEILDEIVSELNRK